MTPQEVHQRLNDDLEFFNAHAGIVIKDKQGRLIPFRFNIAQRYIHDRLEEQLRLRGWVRACLLKGRQQGGSTYINNRNFHKVVRRTGVSAFILSHESKATDRLFDMVRRFYDNMVQVLRPALGKDNPREMTFPALFADYSAATAKNENAGRGGTAQLFHWSEPAYSDTDYAIQDGALQSIGLVPGTEVVLESTANGPKGLFYEKCDMALHGLGDYILIFVPWFWQPEYEREDDGSPLTEAEQKYVDTYLKTPFPYEEAPPSLDRVRRKMLWRRAQIVELGGRGGEVVGRAKFRSSYPSNPVEAFLSTGVGIIRGEAVEAARANYAKCEVWDHAPRILGVDPAGDGKKSDRTVIVLRQGKRIEWVIKYPKMTPMALVDVLSRLIDRHHVDMTFIDRGYGEGTIDQLKRMGYRDKVVGVSFAETASNPKYRNKRSEIIIETANWFNEMEGVAMPNLPTAKPLDDRDPQGPAYCSGNEIHADLVCMLLDKEDANGIKYMPAKEEIRKALGRSPDIYDAIALTFAYPVRKTAESGGLRKAETCQPVSKGGGPLKSLARMRARRSR